MASATAEIRTTLNAYGAALRTRSLEDVLAQYASDGVFMPPGVEFDFKEIVMAGEQWAFARTTAHGKKAWIEESRDEDALNQELFVMKHEDGKWKIARYAFNSMKPRL
ncbi:uncharacterized protein AB675_1731 [Cyphellophora attinorum]|uniref:DUF4440 domain-containing protein n=1 Tax=Cyphellophora attinorum TaxID=1664694 RepID=A0A0N0NPS1_9EURO|nr:uncharacterized protein AB675_1731 [Phialophora attinorum]KPI42869.1 hypothetical protein AB675_1731 [Phialophora attinorum]